MPKLVMMKNWWAELLQLGKFMIVLLWNRKMELMKVIAGWRRLCLLRVKNGGKICYAVIIKSSLHYEMSWDNSTLNMKLIYWA